MMTTLGATISKTLVKALLSWCTTSLPAAAASAGTVGVGCAADGGPGSGAAGKLPAIQSARKRQIEKGRCISGGLDRSAGSAVQTVAESRNRANKAGNSHPDREVGHAPQGAFIDTKFMTLNFYPTNQNAYSCRRQKGRKRVHHPRSRLLAGRPTGTLERLEMAAQEPRHHLGAARAASHPLRGGAGGRSALRR